MKINEAIGKWGRNVEVVKNDTPPAPVQEEKKQPAISAANRYLITSALFGGEIEFRYRDDAALKFFENRSAMEDSLLSRLFTKFPFTRPDLIALCKGSQLILAQIAVTITFKEFWDAYGYKVGNKARAEKLWNALTDTERVMVMEHLPKYDAYLAARPKMEKLYAETYLAQRRFENELPR